MTVNGAMEFSRKAGSIIVAGFSYLEMQIWHNGVQDN